MSSNSAKVRRLNCVIAWHQAGDLAAAEEGYRAILAEQPQFPDALHLLGLVHHQRGDYVSAVPLISEALKYDNKVAAYHNNLGACWHALGKLERAEECYGRAIKLNPKYVDALANIASIHREMGAFEQAESEWRMALNLAPGNRRMRSGLIDLLLVQRRWREASSVCATFVKTQPEHEELWIQLAAALTGEGRLPEAEAALRKAHATAPDNPQLLSALGGLLVRCGRYSEGAAFLERALERDPNHVDAYTHLGILWHENRQFEQCLLAMEKAWTLRPGDPDTSNYLGIALRSTGRATAAAERFRDGLSRWPRHPGLLNNLGLALKDLGDISGALACFDRALAVDAHSKKAASNYLMTLHFDPDKSIREVDQAHCRWGEEFARSYPTTANHILQHPRRHGLLRVGYLSPDLNAHPVGYFMDALLRHHDRTGFEIHCFDNSRLNDRWTVRLRGHAHRWHSISGMSDTEVIALISRLEIDIIVDLAGHTARNRLGVFACNAAPVQVTYLGYPGTVGLPQIGFRLSDTIADPEGAEQEQVEQLVRLPRCAWCYTESGTASVQNLLPLDRNGFVTFGCFNNFAKINAVVSDQWSRLLSLVPESRLLLKGAVFNDAAFVARTCHVFAQRGVAKERLLLQPREDELDAHLARYNDIDIALDTFPYHGTTTTCDALWMGVPVVTLRGDRHASRVGASLLHCVGLDRFVTDSWEQYVAAAAALAADHISLRELRRTLRATMQDSDLMDGPGFARAVESAFRLMIDSRSQ